MRGIAVGHRLARARIALALAALLASAGCVRWSVDPRPPREAIVGAQAEWARITLRSGRAVEVHRPGVRGDSIVGGSPAGSGASDVALPLSDVTRIEWQSVDEGATLRSVAWIAIGSLVLLGGFFLLVMSTSK